MRHENKYKKVIDIINLLLQKTERGELQWESTIWPNVYQISFTNSSIQIEKLKGNKKFLIRIFDEQGELVEEFSTEQLEKHNNAIKNAVEKLFFRVAGKKMVNSEKIIDDILHQISSH